MHNYVKKLGLRWSDPFLLIWLLLGSLMCIEQNRFVSHSLPWTIDFKYPFTFYVISFVVMIMSITVYFLLECKFYKSRTNIWIIIMVLFIIVSQAETILMAPNTVKILAYDSNDSLFDIIGPSNPQIRLLHFFNVFFLIVSIYILISFIPMRFKNKELLVLIVYIFYIVGLIATIYSYINDDYILLFKYVFKRGDVNPDLKYTPVSIFGNSNLYGMFFEMAIFFSLLNYYLTNKKWNLAFTIYFYINMLLTLCKAAIIISTICVFLFFVINVLIPYIKGNKKRIIIASLSLFALISIIVLIVVLGSSLFKNDIARSYNDRKVIWSYSTQIISKSHIASGMGYGIYNTLISNACLHINLWYSSITHNWCLCILGEYGIIGLVSYLTVLIYGIITILKANKSNMPIKVISFGLLSFFCHSFVEDNYYLVIVMISIILFINNIDKVNRPISKCGGN